MTVNLTNLPQGSDATEGRARLVVINGRGRGGFVQSEMALIGADGNILWRGEIGTGGWGRGALPGMDERTVSSAARDRAVLGEYRLNYTQGATDGYMAARPDMPTFSYANGQPGFSLGILNANNIRELGGAGRDAFRIHPGGGRLAARGQEANSAGCIKIENDGEAREFIRTIMALPENQRPASLEILNHRMVPNMTQALAGGTPAAPAASPAQNASAQDNNDERDRRNTQRDGDAMGAMGSGIADAFLSFLRALLPTWLYDLIFTDNQHDLNDDERDPTPVSRGERLGNARAIVDSRALPRYEEFKRERGNAPVTHINPSGDDATQTSGFGPRNSRRTTNGNRMSSDHRGVDLVGTSEIRASADGVVLFSGRAGGYGNLVVIGHADGTETRYGHMTGANMPRVGSTVNQRDVIGVMGATGNVTGAHLHFEIRRNGVALNPADHVAGLDRGNGGRQHAGHDHDEPRRSTAGRLPVRDVEEPSAPRLASLSSTSIGSMLRG